jgi:hypothetical protein
MAIDLRDWRHALIRWLLITFAAVSLLVCGITAAVLVRSFWVCDWVRFSTEGGDKQVSLSLGRFSYYSLAYDHPGYVRTRVLREVRRPASWDPLQWTFSSAKASQHPLGAVTVSGVSTDGPFQAWNRPYWGINLPLWPLATLSAVPALAFALLLVRRQIRRRTRRLAGSCLNCGYDLRSSPERCSECGAVRERPEDATMEPFHRQA